jgi:hypothetical protein
LSEASSDSSDIIDAALGGGREGHEAPTRPAVMGFATALAVTGVVTHRRRRGRRGLATAQPVQPAMMAAALEYVAPSLDRVVMFTEVPNENPLQILVGAS